MKEINRQEFEEWMERLGLDPAHHDVEGLRQAWAQLFRLMRRMDDPARAPDADSLSTFDPTRRP